MQRLFYDTLYDQYKALGLPTALLDKDREFTIFDLKDLNRTFPFQSPVSRLNFFVFVFVKSGSGYYVIDDQTYDVGPGTVYFTNPGHWRSFHWLHVESVYLITMNENFLRENVSCDIFDEFPFLLSETFPGKAIDPSTFFGFEETYLHIHRLHHSTMKYRRRMIGNLFTVILLRIKELFWQDYQPQTEGERRSIIVRDFKILINKHYGDLVSGKVTDLMLVRDYAECLQLHPGYLNSVIKSKTGKPASEWLAEKHLAEARSLLIHTPMSMKEIAFILGFQGAAHFSTYFKRHTGHSPSTYRELNRR